MTARILSMFLVVTLAGSRLLAAPPPDDKATNLLVGSWVVPRNQYSTTSKDGGFTFKPDGTFSSYEVFRVHGKEVRIEIKGTWRVKDGILIEQLTKSNQPQIARVGSITRDTLLAVTEKQYRFRTERGVEHTYLRK